ncbi:hypothetical protein B0H19DRAFT_397901 [Mycena capillaripes]|nr:hypothetical protein B0H19DRAFT_397901 [Mycena capillaripes]
MTTHAPHSLPSFAQAFSAEPPLGSISSGNNSLPPIHSRSRAKSPQRPSRSRHNSEEDRVAGRKRSRTEITSSVRDDEPSDSDRDSPRLIRIKEEQELDMLEDSPPPQQRMILDQTGAPPPSSIQPSAAKKRRVTVSGPPQLNTDVRSQADQLSPVVVGFSLDNPNAIEQVRSMITVKQKQKALIEQRRGSIVASPSIAPPSLAVLAEERVAPAKPPPSASARQRRSPNSNTTRRTANGRPPSPPAPVESPAQNSLPPPPISFARRRAEQLGGRRKPADIIISPREAHTQEQFQPAIQSAPPIPQGGGQASFYSGRFPMTLPRLPSVMGGADSTRKVPGHVPPTPTRLSMQRNNSTTAVPSLTHPVASAPSARSPPAASVPIASTLVPPTPMSLHHPGYSGDKSAFLAPFEVFYDALNDSKQMKNWLGEQLQRSNTLIQNLTQQQEKLNETVEMMVERKLGSMRAEMAGLYRRVDELEDALRLATGRRQSVDSGSLKAKGKQPLRNGVGNLMASETYTFPPRPQPQVERPSRRHASPGWSQQERDRDTQSTLESENGSPAPFDARRLSLSATRLDPPRQTFEASAQRSSLNNNMHSPPMGFHAHSSPSSHAKIVNSHPERPGLPRQGSSHTSVERERERGGSPQHDSRRNSVVMSSPDAPDDS